MSELEIYTIKTGIISKKTVKNSGRQEEIDLARGFSALLIIIVHIGLYVGADKGLYIFSDIAGSEFGAPVFATLMGTSVVYSRRNDVKSLVKRGVTLLFTGYMLNFARSIIPYLILGKMAFRSEWAGAEAFYVVDIMQFAGLTFLFLGVLKKMKAGPVLTLLLAVLMVIADQYVMKCSVTGIPVITGVVDLFVPVSDRSCFPFLTWFFFPAFGLCFGKVLLRIRKNVLYGILFPTGLVVVMYVYGSIHRLYPGYTEYYYGGNFYRMGLTHVLLNALMVCFALSFWHFAGKAAPKSVKRLLTFLSRNLMEFYIISWVIITVLIYTGWKPAFWGTVFLAVGVYALCIILLKILMAEREKIWKSEKR